MNVESGTANAVPPRSFSEEEQHKTLKKVTFSSFLGNFIEWFDYASYSYLATVIALVFFPGEDRFVAVMSTFAVFALSFLVRPIGAVFWGNMGDKKGRKWALSISILMMSGATFLIGCLPGYALLGVGAPLLLLALRMVQSFSAAGEYAGAATFIAEYAPKNHRGFYCSMVPASTATGLLVGSLFATFMFNTWGATSDFVVDWGWRIPFLLALPLGYITHYIRTHLEDSPVYEEMQEHLKQQGSSVKHPIRTLFKKHLRVLIISFGACVLNAVGFYAVLTYLPNYLETTLNYDPSAASIITTIVLVAYIGFIFISGRISDRFGRKKMLIIACVGFIVLTIPPHTHHQRRHAVQLPDRDVPHRCALLRVRVELQPGQRHLRRLGVVHLVLVDRYDGQRHRARVLHGVHRRAGAGGHDPVARAHGQGLVRGVGGVRAPRAARPAGSRSVGAAPSFGGRPGRGGGPSRHRRVFHRIMGRLQQRQGAGWRGL